MNSETHEITVTSYGGSHSGTVNFTLETPIGVEQSVVLKMAQEKAEDELRDSGYRTGPYTLEINGEEID